MVEEMQYLVLLADIVSSRSIQSRSVFQEGLRETFSSLPGTKQGTVVSPFTITLGDEFQAVYRSADSAIADILSLCHCAYPHKTRFSLAIGTLATRLNPKEAIGMDGPVFHAARDGIVALKKTKRTVIRIQPLEEFPFENSFLEFFAVCMAKWKRNSFLIMRDLLLGEGTEGIGKRLGITRRAVYDNMKNHGLSELRPILLAIQKKIAKELERE